MNESNHKHCFRYLETKHGDVEFPTVFPVLNTGTHRYGTVPQFWKTIPDLPHVMLNARFLGVSEIWEEVKEMGIHRLLDVDGAVFMDSGGLQAKKYGLALDPIEILRIQETSGADICATLDVPILYDENRSNISYGSAIRKNIENSILALKNRRSTTRLYAALHGRDNSTVLEMIALLKEKGFDGFALGGLVQQRSNYRHLVDLVLAVRREIDQLPLHVFGLAGTCYIPLLVYLGVDSMDSSAFATAGGNRVYFLPGRGSIDIRSMSDYDYLPCICPVCSTKEPEAIRNNRQALILHNLWATALEIRKVKSAIREGELESYLGNRFEFNRFLSKAFEYARTRRKWLKWG